MRRVWVLFMCAATLCMGMPRVASGGPEDPWYEDMDGHWSYRDVRVLWEEEVADGYLSCGKSYFRPDALCTRAELAVMLAKAFRLAPLSGRQTFIDVPPGYVICDAKTAHPFIEAAAAAGLVKGDGQGRFLPSLPVTREQAVAMLVRGLGLGPFCDMLKEPDVAALLARFMDGPTASPTLARELAVAIYLLIIRGYPDGTVQPQRLLLRSEGATIVARSCMVRAEASPLAFSPDGDGIEDTTEIRLHTLKNRAICEWELRVVNPGTALLRYWQGWLGTNDPNPIPSSFTWDGRDLDGRPVGDGTYFCLAWVRDTEYQFYATPLMPVIVERPRIWAFIFPPSTTPGGSLTLTAFTSGYPRSVTVKSTAQQLIPFGNTWSTSIFVPPWASPGSYAVTVEAIYPSSAVRQATAYYEVVDPMPLDARVVPASAVPGQTVAIHATTSDTALATRAWFPWSVTPLLLTRLSPIEWEISTIVPRLTSEGNYGIVVTADYPSKVKTVALNLEITLAPLRRLVPSLIQ